MADSLRMLLLLGAVVVAAGVRQWFVMRRHVASVAQGLLKLRRLQAEDTAYSPLTASENFHPVAQGEAESVTAELRAQGFTILGDRMEQRPGGPRLGPSRWFASSDGTTCGWFAVLATPKGTLRPVMTLFSESEAGQFFSTVRGGASPHLAQPPTLVRELIPWTEGLPAAFGKHRGGTSRVTTSFKRVAALDDATSLLQRLRGAIRQWRAQQTADVLLEADLQAVLGKHYKRMSPAVRRYIKEHA